MQTVTVVVPVYRPDPSELERFALHRCAAVLNRYPLAFVGPRDLDYSAYQKLVPAAQVVRMDGVHFESKSNYNRLMSSPVFYEQFCDYRFILVHETDAFVFEDHLADWCAQPYDYVGAPWFKQYGADKSGALMGVGNSGFCLRGVRQHLEALNSVTVDHSRIVSDLIRRGRRWKRALHYFGHALRRPRRLLPVQWYLERFYFASGAGNDLFWGWDAVKFDRGFRVAPVDEAVYFAFEMGLVWLHPRYRDRLPFGCHADWNLKKLYAMLHRNQPPQEEYDRLLLDLYQRAAPVESFQRPSGP